MKFLSGFPCTLGILGIICSSILLLSLEVGASPTAISIPVRTDWFGYDGSWSPVSIRVGSPPQWVDLFVSTMSEETWVVGPGGCDSTQICQIKRGGLFQSNESSTWQSVGFFELGLDPQLGFGDYGDYGYDNIALDDQTSVPSQIIGVINSTDYWLGFLGLGVKPTNFTSQDKPTFLDSIVENQSLVPSHSYGYTAGAYYRLKTVPSSLTIGGYDANRFDPHNISFNLDPNQNPVVSLVDIIVTTAALPTSNISTGWSSNSLTLSETGDAEFYTIDSSTPYLWLPKTICARFEEALGLNYDEALQLYTFDTGSPQHEILKNWNMTFNFVIADLPGSSRTVSISLPYAAFDLQLSYPFPGLNATASSSAINYFPLRKAANSTQNTIGRAFLQESYLIVDYERNNFSVHQATFATDAITNNKLIDITRPENSTFAGPDDSGHSVLGKSALAGITVGLVLILAIIVAFWLCLRQRRRHLLMEGMSDKLRDGSIKKASSIKNRFLGWLSNRSNRDYLVEVAGSSYFATEAPTGLEVTELPGSTMSELPGGNTEIGNLESADQKSPRGNIIVPVGHNPKKPVELQDQSSLGRFFEPEKDLRTSPTPLATYSPCCLERQDTHDTKVPSKSSGEMNDVSSQSSTPIFSPLTPEKMEKPALARIKQDRGAFALVADRVRYHVGGRETLAQERSAEIPNPDSGFQEGPRKFNWEEDR